MNWENQTQLGGVRCAIYQLFQLIQFRFKLSVHAIAKYNTLLYQATFIAQISDSKNSPWTIFKSLKWNNFCIYNSCEFLLVSGVQNLNTNIPPESSLARQAHIYIYGGFPKLSLPQQNPCITIFVATLFLDRQFQTRSGRQSWLSSLGISLHGHPEGMDDAGNEANLRKREYYSLNKAEQLTRQSRMLMSSLQPQPSTWTFGCDCTFRVTVHYTLSCNIWK